MQTGKKDREIEAQRNGRWIQASLRSILHNTSKFPAAPNPSFLVTPSSFHFYKPSLFLAPAPPPQAPALLGRNVTGQV